MFPFGPVPNQPIDVPEAEEPTVGELSDIEEIMGDKTLRWRAVNFADMGFNAHQARALALRRQVDLHYVRDVLIGRGCDPDVAFDIAS